MATSKLCLSELFHELLRDFNEEKAREIFNKLNSLIVIIKEEHIFNSAKVKLSNRELSTTEALNYAIAMAEGMKFLTGDDRFSNLDNVEFVK